MCMGEESFYLIIQVIHKYTIVKIFNLMQKKKKNRINPEKPL